MKGDNIMDLQDYKKHLRTAFPKAVRHCIDNPHDWFVTDKKIKQAARIHHKEWGFSCLADCFEAVVPRSRRLQLEKWSMSEIAVDHWTMDVSCRAFYLGGSHTRIEVRNTGQSSLPFTATGHSLFPCLPSKAAKHRRILSGHSFQRLSNLSSFKLSSYIAPKLQSLITFSHTKNKFERQKKCGCPRKKHTFKCYAKF